VKSITIPHPPSPIPSFLPFLPCAAEAARAALGLFEVVGPGGFRQGDALDDELRDARADLDLDRRVAVVDERAQNLAAVVRVNDARQRVESRLDRQPGARRDPPVEAGGDRHRQPRPHSRARAGPKRHALDRVEVKPRGQRAAARRQPRLWVKPLESKSLEP